MALEIADIVSEYGEFYIPGSANTKNLISLQKQKTVTPSYATPIVTDATIYRAPQTYMSEVVQAFQKNFTEKGTITFKPNDIPLYKLKIDLSLYPDELEETYLGFLTNIAEADRSNWPLIKWLLEVHVLEQRKEDMEKKVYGKGVYAAPTNGTASTAASSMNGIIKLITDGLAGTITPHSLMNAVALTAPFAEATAFDGVEEFADNFEDVLDDVPMVIGMPTKWLKWYLRDKRNIHGTDVNYKDGMYTVDFADNLQLVGLPSMAGTDTIFATPKKNFIHLSPKTKMNPIKVESAKRVVDILGDWREGLGFLYNELVYVYQKV
jgi:hypothetical protein